MKVRIKPDVCVGQGMCQLAAPQLFELSDEDGHAYLTSDDVPHELEDAVRQAERGCPEGAIEIFAEDPAAPLPHLNGQ